MPEGDTIHRTARTLERVLAGRTVCAVDHAPQHPGADRVGRAVVRVEARGKNLLVHFDDDRVLYTHMRMTGSWHVYRAGERWRRPRRQLRIALHTERMVAACFNAPVVELLSAFALRRHRLLSRLGPDLLAHAPDFEEILRRAYTRGASPLGEVVMAQDVACGIGNVYKSETLFLARLDPFVPLAHHAEEVVRGVFERARRLMQVNLTGYPRVTHPEPPEDAADRPGSGRGGPRYWVYGRAGEPCLRCGERVEMKRQGDAGRSTYFCRGCQGVEPRARRSGAS